MEQPGNRINTIVAALKARLAIVEATIRTYTGSDRYKWTPERRLAQAELMRKKMHAYWQRRRKEHPAQTLSESISEVIKDSGKKRKAEKA